MRNATNATSATHEDPELDARCKIPDALSLLLMLNDMVSSGIGLELLYCSQGRLAAVFGDSRECKLF